MKKIVRFSENYSGLDFNITSQFKCVFSNMETEQNRTLRQKICSIDSEICHSAVTP